MSFFLILFFPPSLNWERERESEREREREREREYVIAVLRKDVGRNSLKVYLAFWRVPSESIWLECVCHLVQELYVASSPGVWHEIRPSVHGDHCLQNWFSYPYFCWRKGCYFRFRVLANHSVSFFFLRAIHSDYYMSIYPILYPSGHRMQTSVGFHSDPDLLLRPRGIDLHSYSFF